MKRREEIVTATLGCRQNYVNLKRPITPDDVADAFEKSGFYVYIRYGKKAGWRSFDEMVKWRFIPSKSYPDYELYRKELED